MQSRVCSPLYAWALGLLAALLGTVAEERLAAGILGTGRVGGWVAGRVEGWQTGWGGPGRVGWGGGGQGGGGAGGVLAGRVGGGWYERSYSPQECLYCGVKNALRNLVG